MSEILKLYKKSIYSKLGAKDLKRPIGLIDRTPPPYDITIPDKTGLFNTAMPDTFDFTTRPLLDRYNEFEPIQFEGQNSILDVYYKTYGYTAMAADAGGYLLGLYDATHVLQSGLNLLIPGATRGGINSFLLNTANHVLLPL